MGGFETLLDCWACKNFDGDGLKTTGRSCRLHDFVMPRAGARFLCRDHDCAYGDNPELRLLEPFERGTLLYSGYPYWKGIYRFAPIKEIQKRVFGVDFVLGRHYDKQFEFPEYVFPLGMAQMLWKPFPPMETRILFGDHDFSALISIATDLRNNDTQPVLHSFAALPKLLEWSGFNATQLKFKRAHWRVRGYEAFVECADDLSEFRFTRHEVWVNMPEMANVPG